MAATQGFSRMLAAPFRVFFPLAGAFALVSMAGWIAVFASGAEWRATLPPLLWHAHEMIYGYAAAVFGGFLPTAVANWTGRPAVRGLPLAALAVLWLLGRLACASSLPAALIAVIDLAFLPALVAVVAVPIVATGNRRQWVLLGGLGALSAANLAMHLDAAGIEAMDGRDALILAVDLLMIPIGVMGGRVIPAFTGNALRQRGETRLPRTRPWVEWLAVPSLALVALCDAAQVPAPLLATVALGAAAVHGVRLSGWRGGATLRQPILWVLHLGYGWLAAGLALKGLSALVPAAVPGATALHALTVGTLGTLSLGLMPRVTRGHTGRPLVVGPVVTAAWGLITASALLRVGGPILLPDHTVVAQALSGACWLAAFGAFLWDQAGMVTKPRVDGRPG